MGPEQHSARIVALMAHLADDDDTRSIPAASAYAVLRYATLNAARLAGLGESELRRIAAALVVALTAESESGP